MDKKFSAFLEAKKELLKEIVDKLSKDFDYVSLLASDCAGKNILVSDKNISVKDSNWQERGFVVRVYKKGLYSEYSFDNFDNVNEICKKIKKSVDISEASYKAIYVKVEKNDLFKEEKLVGDYSRMEKYKCFSIEELIDKSKKIIEDSKEEYEYIISARINIEYLKISKLFISSTKLLSQVYAWANATYMCIVNKDDSTKSNYGAASGISLVETFEKMKKMVKQTNEDACALLDATYVKPGEYDCITSPDISGLIAHEAFGHGVEMDMFVKNRAMGAQYINERVGSDLVEMHEGAIPQLDVSSYFFDDEGTLAHDTIEIQNGILKTGIADIITATKLKIQATGNGKRENYKHKAYTRMTNTYFSPKNSTLDQMISSIKYGFLIDKELSGMEDPKNWGIQCVALIGKEIKDGKLTGKIVSPLIMTGSVLDLLNSISMVSKDFKLYGSGACGKGYKEWVKTSVGGPYMKVKVKLG